MPQDDRVRLLHMRDAANEALHFVSGRNKEDLEDDRLLTFGLMKCIEIIGEASARISQQTKELYPQIPWMDIIGMRNRLIHTYFDIDLDRLWDTVTQDLPLLIDTLEQILKDRS